LNSIYLLKYINNHALLLWGEDEGNLCLSGDCFCNLLREFFLEDLVSFGGVPLIFDLLLLKLFYFFIGVFEFVEFFGKGGFVGVFLIYVDVLLLPFESDLASLDIFLFL
jgi:hypothetical protein